MFINLQCKLDDWFLYIMQHWARMASHMEIITPKIIRPFLNTIHIKNFVQKNQLVNK